MPNSMFASLLNMLDKRSVSEVAQTLGQPDQSVSRGMELSIASLLAGMARKSDDPAALQGILDTVSHTTGDISWSQVASQIANPNSSLIVEGKRVLATLFGSGETAVTSGISRESGLSSGATSTLLAAAAPIVMSFLSKQVREGEMTMGGFGSLLQREIATIGNALPSDLRALFWPTATTESAISPVIAQAVQSERSFRWFPALAIAALGLGLLWLLAHARRPSIPPAPPVTAGTANRLAAPSQNLVCTLPANINIPAGAAEASLLAFVQNPDTKPVSSTWFSFDQLVFDTGSATLGPESQAQLNNIAAILTNCPSVHVEIAGYTDNVGSAEPNLRLSRSRANTVTAQLIGKGVSRDRLTAEGYGKEYSVADNSTETGRAQNRRIAIRVTQK